MGQYLKYWVEAPMISPSKYHLMSVFTGITLNFSDPADWRAAYYLVNIYLLGTSKQGRFTEAQNRP